jgi:hypothetical protein
MSLAARWRCWLACVRRAATASCGAALWLVAGCGAAPSETAAVPEPSAKPRSGEGIVAEGEIGGLSQEDVETAFEALAPAVQRCAEQGMSRNDALAGSCTVALRITRDGSVHWAYLRDSTLGDRRTELCILDAVRARSWPKPLGGEGEAEHSFTIESPVSVPTWDDGRVRPVRGLLARKAGPCLRRTRGRFLATVYVRADGSVLSAGVAPPSAAAEDRADCVVEALGKVNLGKQRTRLSKGTFKLP